MTPNWWHLTTRPGPVLSTLGLALFVCGWWIMSLALLQNAFAAPAVTHQEERQQTVIDSGVYGVVRHPMYAGALPLLVGMPLWLESYSAAAFAIVLIGILMVRIVFEEKFLRRKLSGYNAYADKVHYQLIPYVC
ncbi:MAG: methyltransferase family protein [Planctomycetales bacterium]